MNDAAKGDGMAGVTTNLGRCLVCLVAIVFGISTGGCDKVGGPEDGNYSAEQAAQLADCLTANGAVLYGADWCPYTHQQIDAFGDAFTRINYVECTAQPSVCEQAGISGYPTWVIGGRVQSGLHDLATLAEISGCN